MTKQTSCDTLEAMKNLKEIPKWETGGPHNIMLKGDGFHISYNKDTDELGEFLRGDAHQETALVKDGKYYILNGDWREDYEKLLIHGFEVCKKFFDKNNIGNNTSTWSNK